MSFKCIIALLIKPWLYPYEYILKQAAKIVVTGEKLQDYFIPCMASMNLSMFMDPLAPFIGYTDFYYLQ